MHLFTLGAVFLTLLSHAVACCALTSGSRFVVNAPPGRAIAGKLKAATSGAAKPCGPETSHHTARPC
jgi:hypothetical protein